MYRLQFYFLFLKKDHKPKEPINAKGRKRQKAEQKEKPKAANNDNRRNKEKNNNNKDEIKKLLVASCWGKENLPPFLLHFLSIL